MIRINEYLLNSKIDKAEGVQYHKDVRLPSFHQSKVVPINKWLITKEHNYHV